MDILNEPNNPQNQENNSINSNTHEKKGTFFKKKIIYIFSYYYLEKKFLQQIMIKMQAKIL